jgi:hypothetical protein
VELRNRLVHTLAEPEPEPEPGGQARDE